MSAAVNSLRAGSVVTALLFAGHTSGMPWTPFKTTAGDLVVAAMKGYHTEVLGVTRGYWDFYQGFGVAVSACLAGLAILIWQLAGLARSSPQAARPMIATLLATFIANGVIDWIYFVWPPLVFTVAIILCLAVAWVTAKPA
jgi:hypothetical protein